MIDGKPQIKNAVEFQHFFRPNRLTTSYEQEYGEDDDTTFRSREKIEEYMKNRERSKFLINFKSYNNNFKIKNLFNGHLQETGLDYLSCQRYQIMIGMINCIWNYTISMKRIKAYCPFH
jgi:hypothetical protein